MSSAILSGVFALAGVIVGGFVNGAVTFWQDRRRASRDARPAARLVMAELDEMQSILEMNARVEDAEHPLREPDAWPTHRAILASIVDGQTWTALENAYELASYVVVGAVERGLPVRVLWSQGPSPHDISQGILDARRRLVPYADLRGSAVSEPNGTH